MWTHKIARLVPYAASFFIPAAGGYFAATRFSMAVLKFGLKAGKIGRATKVVRAAQIGTATGKVRYVDEVVQQGSGLGRLLKAYKTKGLRDSAGRFVKAKQGVELTNKAKLTLGAIGGGTAGNLSEGMYIAGEAYNQASHEVDEMGNPLFDKEMLGEIGAGAMYRNTAWMGVDIMQFGLLFGGFGKAMKLNRIATIAPTPKAFSVGLKPFLQWGTRKAAAGVSTGVAYAGVEGITEGYQEVFQEWAKYASIEEAKGNDHDTWTDWLAKAPLGEDNELRDIFWSSVGLGAAMGGARGYVDGIAEQTRLYEEKVNRFNTNLKNSKEATDEWTSLQAEERFMDDVITNTIIDHNGSGEVLRQYINDRVNDENNPTTQEMADDWIAAIEQAENDFATHDADTRLNRAGKIQAFFTQTRLTRVEDYKRQVKEGYEAELERNKEIYKNDEKGLKESNAQSEADFLGAMETLNEEERLLGNRLADLYSARRAILTKAGKPKKSSLGVGPQEFEKQTIKGEKEVGEEGRWEGETIEQIKQIQEGIPIEKKEAKSFLQKAGEAIKGAVKGIATGTITLGKKAFTFAKEKRTEIQIKKDLSTIKDIDMADDVRTVVNESIEEGLITAKEIQEIEGTGENGQIIKKDVFNFLNEKEKAEKEKKTEVAEEEVTEEVTEEAIEEEKLKTERVKSIKALKKRKNITETARKKAIKAIEEGVLSYEDIPKKGTGANGKVILPDIRKALKKKDVSQRKAKKKAKKVSPKEDNKKTKKSIFKKITGTVATGVTFVKEKVKGVLSSIDEQGKDIEKQVSDALAEYDKYSYKPYVSSGVAAKAMAVSVVRENFPNSNAFVMTERLIADYGQNAVSLAIGSSIFINEDDIMQTDFVHELGHVYYGIHRNTPLMKRIALLLSRSPEYDIVAALYPELTRINIDNKFTTAGELYKQILLNGNKELNNIILDLVEQMRKVEGVNDTKFAALMGEFITHITAQEGYKLVGKSYQHGIIEEMFTRSLEAASAGTLNTILPDTKARKALEEELLEMYKKTKKLATKEEAKKFLEFTDADIKSMTLEEAIRHVLLNFNTKGAHNVPIGNSYRKGAKKASKEITREYVVQPLLQILIRRRIGLALPEDDMVKLILKDMRKHTSLSINETNEAYVKEYVRDTIIRVKRPKALQDGDKKINSIIKNLVPGLLEDKLDNLEEMDYEGLDEETFTDQFNDEIRRRAIGPTTMNFLKKFQAIYNNTHKEPLDIKNLIHQLFSLAQENKKDPYDFVLALRENQNKYNEIRKLKRAEKAREIIGPLPKGVERTYKSPYDINEAYFEEAGEFLNFLDKMYDGKSIVATKLLFLANDFANGVIERMGKMGLGIKRIGDKYEYIWKRQANITVVEDKKIKNLIDKSKNQKDKKKIIKEIERYYKVLLSDKEGKFDFTRQQNAAIEILKLIFEKNRNYDFIDWGAVRNEPLLYNGKRKYISEILFGHDTRGQFWNLKWKTKDGKRTQDIESVTVKNWQLGMDGSMNSVREILKESMILSRPRNFMMMVEDVEFNAISVYNKENSLLNRVKNMHNLVETGEVIGELTNPSYNRFIENIYNGKKLDIIVNTGIYNYLVHTTEPNFVQRASKFKKISPEELMLTDFFDFAETFTKFMIYQKKGTGRVKGKKKMNKDLKELDGTYKVVNYEQPIAVFSDKSRRHNILSEMAYNQETLNRILGPVFRNPRTKNGKYENGDFVFPFNIVEKDGNYFIAEKNKGKKVGLKTLRKNFLAEMGKNKELVTGMNAIEQARKAEMINEMINYYIQSYVGNKFMAQQLLIGDHVQFKNETDYIKRAAGAIAPHIPFDRNTPFEAVIFKDYVITKDGEILPEGEAEGYALTDAMGFVLPEQAKLIRAKYGNVRKVGNIFKFVYHYNETENPNLLGKTTYLKFAVHEITPKMEKISPHFKRLADTLRARVKNIAQSKFTEYTDDLMFAHNHLVIGTAQSSAKVFLNKENRNDFIYDLDDKHDLDYINEKQNELYFEGDEASTVRRFKGLHGEGLGLQLELDKESRERQVPSQVFYHLATNAKTKTQKAKIKKAYKLMREIKEMNNENKNKDILKVNWDKRYKKGFREPTSQEIARERTLLENSISSDIYGSAKASIMKYINSKYPGVNAIFSGMVTGRIVKYGTKLPTKGAIMYQSSDLGINLRAYKRISELVNDKGELIITLDDKWGESNNKKYAQALKDVWEKSQLNDVDYLISEAIIPDYMQSKYNVGVGEMFIGTRVPAHGKVSTAIFIVRDFHEQNNQAASSVITIPAEVSAKWGADLDGDAVHTNFFWNEKDKDHSIFGKVNEFLDNYLDIMSETERQNEVTQELEFEDSHKKAMDNAESILGIKEKDKPSQLTPIGDMQQFKDNVPATALVGRVAATQRITNLMALHEEALPGKGIKIKGYGKKKFNSHTNGMIIDKFVDGINKETGQEYWYGVAQLLNVILDNAKHQLAGRLGINNHTAAIFILLRRMGYSIDDLAILFNSKVVRDLFIIF
jgi:hypothetical protein